MKKNLLFIALCSLVLSGCEGGSNGKYKLSFESEYGSVEPIEVQYGHTLSNLPDVPTTDGLSGYWTIDGTTITTDTVYNYNCDKTAIAQYEAITYTLAFNGASSKKVKFNEPIGELPSIPSKEGYVATSGWKIDGEEITSETIYKWAANKVATVDYSKVQYNLTFEGTDTIKKLSYGDCIGELPEFPIDADKPVDKYDYYWTIDDEIINEQTIYNYYEDKEAMVYTERIDQYIVSVDTDIMNSNLKTIHDAISGSGTSVSIDFDAIQKLMNAKVRDAENKKVVISWTYKNSFEFDYNILELSKEKDLSNIDSTYVALGSVVELNKVLDTNTTYYYKISSYKGEELVNESNVRSFVTEDTYKTYNVNNYDVDNLRDALAYKSEDTTKKIKQGLVYRCATLDSISANSKSYLKEILNIKTDIDLRGDGERAGLNNKSPIGDDVTLKYVSRSEGGVCYYGGQSKGTGLNEVATESKISGKSTLREELQVFLDKDNYPIIFHCQLGRDRTGTLNTILLGLCGVSLVDIYRDYFASMISKSGQNDGSSAEALHEGIAGVIDLAIIPSEGNTIQEKTKNYLINNNVLNSSEVDTLIGILTENV